MPNIITVSNILLGLVRCDLLDDLLLYSDQLMLIFHIQYAFIVYMRNLPINCFFSYITKTSSIYCINHSRSPILGEQVIVTKRIVQIGELVITKNKVIENKKIAIDTRSEEVTIRYADGNIEIL
jgi:hypothetical protein